jgi:hypothetical protein
MGQHLGGAMLSKRTLFPLLCLLLISSMTAWAQTTGSIRGEVVDSEGKPLPGVTVVASSKALLGQTRTTYTNEAGVFRFPALPVGTYSVDLTMGGFDKVVIEKVTVGLETTANVPVTMQLGRLEESVTLIGETPLIDVTETGIATNFSGVLLEELPTQHSQFVLMQNTPGVSGSTGDANGDRTIAFGSNMQSNAWLADGVDLSAPETGSVWYTINPDLIEEVQVIAGASAEYGNHMGAVFNVVTKKGGNEFHGGANYYILSDDLTASNFDFRDVDPETDPESAEYHRLEYRQITGQVGGPIIKDRIWFFGGVQTYRDAFSMPGVNPTFAEQAPYKSDKYDVKINALVGQKHELYGFYHYDKWDSPNAPDPRVTPSALAGEGGNNPAWGINWTNTASDNLLLEAGYSGWWSDDIYDAVVGGDLQDPFIDYTPADGGSTFYSGGVWYPWDYETWRSTIKGKATYYADEFLNSAHEFKFGAQYSLGSALTNRGIGANGFYTYNYYGTLYRVYQDPFVYGAENKELGIFIDDTITVNDRLTLNVGVRFDHNIAEVPEYDQLTIGTPSVSPAGNFASTGETIPGVEVSNWNLISPRVGFTYQPTGDGRSKIQGSFGVYYDHNVSGNWDFPPPQMPDINAFIFNEETQQFDIPYYTIPGDAVVVAQNIDPPRALNYTIGYEQQFGESIAAGIQYVYKDTQDMVGWNATGGVYEPFLFVDPFTGREYTLFKIVERPIITKGNDPGDLCARLPQASACAGGDLDYFQTYHGVMLNFEKRFSNSWALNASYTWSKSEGLSARPLPQTQNNPAYGTADGSDFVNHHLNATGRLQGDRPHMLRVQSVFQQLPLGLHASVLADFSSGRHHTRQIQTPSIGGEGQGRTVIILEQDFRLNPIESIDVTVGREFSLGAGLEFRLDGTVYNILNSDNELSLQTLRLQSPAQDFVPNYWTQPRRLEVRLGFSF